MMIVALVKLPKNQFSTMISNLNYYKAKSTNTNPIAKWKPLRKSHQTKIPNIYSVDSTPTKNLNIKKKITNKKV